MDNGNKVKNLNSVGKKAFKNADKNNRGLGSAGEYPKNWNENSVGKQSKGNSK